eukprot:6857693-Lingulodinium_polyedra.AAC.1
MRKQVIQKRVDKKLAAVKRRATLGFTIKYVKGVEAARWNKNDDIRYGMPILSKYMKVQYRPLQLRYTVGKSLFRRLYRSTWQGGL